MYSLRQCKEWEVMIEWEVTNYCDILKFGQIITSNMYQISMQITMKRNTDTISDNEHRIKTKDRNQRFNPVYIEDYSPDFSKDYSKAYNPDYNEDYSPDFIQCIFDSHEKLWSATLQRAYGHRHLGARKMMKFAHISVIYGSILLILNTDLVESMSNRVIEDSDIVDIWGPLKTDSDSDRQTDMS
ncbi:hypothetical protein FF38_06499 [Lucilia cuprina]|uniref:Uncharacterized protein n=1 Tax=Lucilia cuprina TaxID=7375 RepID=A0A0L0C5C8_LUCCU|nr:hypothetical protein FF38_06499 [Lucilia cuprina]